MPDNFPALPHFYRFLFLYLEPLSTFSPVLLTWFYPTYFHNQLIPSDTNAVPPLTNPRTIMAIWQLGNCYGLLSLVSNLVFRAVRDALPNDPVAQERIMGAALVAYAIADISHIVATLIGLPPHLRYDITAWNPMTHGNITSVVILFVVRVAWFAGIGRKRYYYGQTATKISKRS